MSAEGAVEDAEHSASVSSYSVSSNVNFSSKPEAGSTVGRLLEACEKQDLLFPVE